MIDAPVMATGTASAATTELAQHVRDAQRAQRPLRIAGAGTWANGGPPVDATETISLASFRGIVEYVPGDLTMTVGAGTPLSDIASATATHDQWLALDPLGSADGTIGATMATASFGPLSTGFGTPRDVVLGFEAVTGMGAIVRGGGRVVKNVAGFDLTRLFTGSRGTLGALTEITVRLRARPAVETTVAIIVDESAAGLRAIGRALRSWPFTPMAAEVVDRRAAAAVGLAEATTLLLRLGGNVKAVAGQRGRAAELGRLMEVDASIWPRMQAIDRTASAVIRISDLPSAFSDRWADAERLAGGGKVIGSPSRGVLRCLPGDVDVGAIAQLRRGSPSAVVVFETLPSPSLWNAFTDEVDSASLAGRVRAAFDPAGILNPGVMRTTR